MLEPCYDSYVPAIELNGGTPVVVSLRLPDYAVRLGRACGAPSRRARGCSCSTRRTTRPARCSPPTTSSSCARSSTGTDILIVSDEVYEHIIFDGMRHESMARYDELAARSFIVGSFGKTYHTTGWKVGYAVAPAALTTEFRKVHQFVTFSTNTPVQHAIADFLAEGRGLRELAPFYQAKRDLFLRLMAGSRFRPLPCRGSYFQLMDYSAITDEGDADFAIRLTQGARRRIDPDVAVPLPAAGAERAAVLFREEGRDARARGGTAGEGVIGSQVVPALTP